MESLGTFLGCTNLIGILGSGLVYLNRARFGDTGLNWREFLLPNLPWMLMTLGKMLVWRAVLIVWLARGMPQSPWRAVTRDDTGREVRAVVRVGAAATG
ncbi:hypothetical protein [Dactylosporangium matsuzakiense]|uniref:Uncharacterized protein n=1 Tax=Dactylosporangium matsuzakiense TaxID=53360 RepID=A0A9W6KXY3_9ACTN|nr:hypothetical protein [Dactylosporangium matsuzakiense]UWZ47766.1 hypothetical protein Dmats_15995 [Dactylosporangium matsuzakiense]GLL08465.1 hypothetical protein GCM10017581_102280 [Dactylosporangium matsuzakiense]